MTTLYDPFGNPITAEQLLLQPDIRNPASPLALNILTLPNTVQTVPPQGEPAVGQEPRYGIWNAGTGLTWWMGNRGLMPSSATIQFVLASPNGYASNFQNDTLVITGNLIWNNENAWTGLLYIYYDENGKFWTVWTYYSSAQKIVDGNLDLSESTQLTYPGFWPRGKATKTIFSDLPYSWMIIGFNASLFPTDYPQVSIIPYATWAPLVNLSYPLYFAFGMRIITEDGDTGFFYPGATDVDVQANNGETQSFSSNPPPLNLPGAGFLNYFPYQYLWPGNFPYDPLNPDPSKYPWETSSSIYDSTNGHDNYAYIFNGVNPGSVTTPARYFVTTATPRLVKAVNSPLAQKPVLLQKDLPVLTYTAVDQLAIPVGNIVVTNNTDGTASATFEEYLVSSPNYFGYPTQYNFLSTITDNGGGSVNWYADANNTFYGSGGGMAGWYQNGFFLTPTWYPLYPDPDKFRQQYTLVSYVATGMRQDFIINVPVSGDGNVDLYTLFATYNAAISPGAGFAGAWVPGGVSVVLPDQKLITNFNTQTMSRYNGWYQPVYGNWIMPIVEAPLTDTVNLYIGNYQNL